jgi:S-adenosylmethionine hydrolase
MTVITLTTDWQSGDYYSGMMKGRLLRLIPGAVIVDLNPHVESFHVLKASFALRESLPEFPAGSIHLFLVNQGHQPAIWPLVVSCDGHYLVGWDDGILPLILKGNPGYLLKVDNSVLEKMDQLADIQEVDRKVEPAFPELSLFTRIACFLASGHTPEEVGSSTTCTEPFNSWLPLIHRNRMDGQVLYIDSYGNAITNIPLKEFLRIGAKRDFEITIKTNHYRIRSINKTYLESEPGELLAIFNSAGWLEIANALGNAADLNGFESGTPVKIIFND